MSTKGDSDTAFLSTPSARRATENSTAMSYNSAISIHALREEGDFFRPLSRRTAFISIHALREEGDAVQRTRLVQTINFYPRPPRGGRRSMAESCRGSARFLSTPSARRATPMTALVVGSRRYFYPRPPRGGRLVPGVVLRTLSDISIHALREEGDGLASSSALGVSNFYPRPPRGGRPLLHIFWRSSGIYFYPRPPRGGRHAPVVLGNYFADFYPRPPRGGRPKLSARSTCPA